MGLKNQHHHLPCLPWQGESTPTKTEHLKPAQETKKSTFSHSCQLQSQSHIFPCQQKYIPRIWYDNTDGKCNKDRHSCKSLRQKPEYTEEPIGETDGEEHTPRHHIYCLLPPGSARRALQRQRGTEQGDLEKHSSRWLTVGACVLRISENFTASGQRLPTLFVLTCFMSVPHELWDDRAGNSGVMELSPCAGGRAKCITNLARDFKPWV